MINSKKAQKNWLRAGMAFVALVVLSMAVVADASVYSYTGPSWRGGAGTTYEQWSFPDSNTSPSADKNDKYLNPYGTPELWIGDRATWSSYVDSYTGLSARVPDSLMVGVAPAGGRQRISYIPERLFEKPAGV